MYANSGRHQTLAAALPISGEGPVVDLGCGRGPTLRALRERFGPDRKLVGVEKELPTLDESLAADANLRVVAADLREPLPFPDETFEAALCHNTLECLSDKQAFLREVARVLRPGGHLLLSHTDFDTIVFNASDLELTRRLVHANADTQEKWMDDSDGTIGRKLVGIGRHSSFELVDTLAWVVLDTSFAEGGVADMAVRGIAPRSNATTTTTSRRNSTNGSAISQRSPSAVNSSSAPTTTRCYSEPSPAQMRAPLLDARGATRYPFRLQGALRRRATRSARLRGGRSTPLRMPVIGATTGAGLAVTLGPCAERPRAARFRVRRVPARRRARETLS